MCARRSASLVSGTAIALVAFAAVFSVHALAESSAVEFYGAPEAGAAPLEVHFHLLAEEAVIQSIASWHWDFGDGGTSDSDYTSHEYATPGTYTVTLTFSPGGGKKQTVSRKDYIRVTSGAPAEAPAEVEGAEPQTEQAVESAAVSREGTGGDDLVFIHHSCGEDWLNRGLHDALLAKDYIDERNDITYGVDVEPDPGRPDSLGPVPGEMTDMNHWILWFNDYLGSVCGHDCADGVNRIVMFKSCFPNSHVESAGAGDPFNDWKTIANYRAVYQHPRGSGNTYEYNGHTYNALEGVFAAHPDTLFIAVTAPPECWQEATAETAANARAFNEWLKNQWLPGYVRATGLHNVAVFDWFDLLAVPAGAGSHRNQLRAEFGGNSGDSHPNAAADAQSTSAFASGEDDFLDRAWQEFGR